MGWLRDTRLQNAALVTGSSIWLNWCLHWMAYWLFHALPVYRIDWPLRFPAVTGAFVLIWAFAVVAIRLVQSRRHAVLAVLSGGVAVLASPYTINLFSVIDAQWAVFIVCGAVLAVAATSSVALGLAEVGKAAVRC